MDTEQRDHITKHMVQLMENVNCNDYLLASLRSKQLLSKVDEEEILTSGGNLSKVKRLLEIVQIKSNSYSFLIESLKECNQTGALSILTKYTGNISPQVALNFQPIPRGCLHKAVRTGNLEDLKHYISLGANVNETNSKWDTALHELKNTRRNWLTFTQVLMENGIVFDALNKDDDNVAHCVSVNEHISKKDYHAWVEYVLEKGYSDIWYQKGWRGRTPLHSAMATIDIEKETIEIILEKTGVNIDERNGYGNTPLHLAVMFGRKVETLNVLVELGANVNLVDKQGNGVLHKAVSNGDVKAVKFFVLETGAKVNCRNNGKSTPLHKVACAKSNHIELTKILLDAGADLGVENKRGENLSLLLKGELSSDEYMKWVDFVWNHVVG